MNLQNRILSFVKLGRRLSQLINDDIINRINLENGWFTRSEINRSLKAWELLLTVENLEHWTKGYPFQAISPERNILVITAGNIPLVGFHDFLSVLISGNRFIGKLSSRDNLLLTLLAEELICIAPQMGKLIQLDGSSTEPDAVIATGSNNTARYMQREYGHLPHIIRRNRSSAAILDGSESDQELDWLSADLLEYYGLGCRSISHLFIPASYPTDKLINCMLRFNQVDPCGLYSDNLRYQSSLLTMLNIPFTDAGQALLVESSQLHSPVGVVNYSFYHGTGPLLAYLDSQEMEIQCLVGHREISSDLVAFGSAQKPGLADYADGVDTLDFLIRI